MDFTNTEDIIKNSKKILIISHVNPDGDALGSTCAVYSAIYTRFKKKCDMCVLSYVSPNYKFLPYLEQAKQSYDNSLVYDLVITVDVAAIDRIAAAKILFDKAKNTINIDHHKTNNNFGDYNYIVPEASSTGEVLYDLFKNSGWEINPDTAECLYTAILTDTGGFRFNNTTENVFKIAAELVKIGVNPNKVFVHCYELKSKNFVMFQNYCINKSVFLDNDKIAYTTVYRRDFEKFSAKDDYTEGLAEQLRAIETTDIAFVVKEIEPKLCKISMRSKKYDAAKICLTFGGGGHSGAAGCTIKSNVEASVKKILDEIKRNNRI
ncbi:MAG: bifunctional oligoribonuclease/PAP phosphatase NrnA [Candidatus Gastranaerophilales bacterium]|nr:bifunctional oligoribonuclease/PAP phosphatase NrnA [Candidatus Gastranaerophilales bacterium]